MSHVLKGANWMQIILTINHMRSECLKLGGPGIILEKKLSEYMLMPEGMGHAQYDELLDRNIKLLTQYRYLHHLIKLAESLLKCQTSVIRE